MPAAERRKHLSEENANISDCSSEEKCNGIMGVPITFLDKYNPEQFEIVGNEYELGISKGRVYVNGKRLYSRVFIRRRMR